MNLDRPRVSGPEHQVRRFEDCPLFLLPRRSSATEHYALEEMIGPRGGTMPFAVYVSLLVKFRALHRTSISWRETCADECRHHRLFRVQCGLIDLIDEDRVILGIRATPTKKLLLAIDRDMMLPTIPVPFCVVACSAFGNALMLQWVRSSFNVACVAATEYLYPSASEVGPTCQDLYLSLNDFGTRMPETCDAVIKGARHKFGTCTCVFGSLSA